jgi:hypothetical protein
VDIKPGSVLETAYGGPFHLGPLPAGYDAQKADKPALIPYAAVSNSS